MSNSEDSRGLSAEDRVDGRLSRSGKIRRRRDIERDSRRLQEIIVSRLRSQGLDFPGIEQAPASLREKLRGIPARHAGPVNYSLRWGLAASLGIILSAVLVVSMRPVPDVPSQAEIIQARKELVLAFGYLRLVGERTASHMRREISDPLQDTIIHGVFHGLEREPQNG